MPSSQDLARQELARRELERRRREKESLSQVPPPVVAQRVFAPDLDDAQVMQSAMAKMRVTPTSRQLKDLPAKLASRTGVYAAGRNVIRSAVGLAKMYVNDTRRANTRVFQQLDLPVPDSVGKQLSSLEEWADTWADNLEWYEKHHPEDFLHLESSGFKDTTLELLGNPIKLVKGGMQSLPLMLEGMLPGGILAMAASSAGDHYLTNLQEGDDPETASIRAWVTAVPEAAIEKATLNAKIGLFKNMKPVIRGGTRKVLWETGKAYMRGVGEEGSQQFNENVWRWVFSDRSTDVFQNVKQSAAVGGPLEAMFSGIAMAGGTIRGNMVSDDQKIERVNSIKDMVADGLESKDDARTVTDALNSVIQDIKAGKYAQPASPQQVEGAEYGLSPQQSDDLMNHVETRFQELDTKRKAAFKEKQRPSGTKRRKQRLKGWTVEEQAEWKFLRHHRGDLTALIEESTRPNSTFNYARPEQKPVRHTRAEYKNMAMNMVAKLEQQDIDAGESVEAAREGAHMMLKEAIIQVTGKDRRLRSLKSPQLEQVAQYMSDFATDGVISEADWDNYVIVNGRRIPMRGVMEQAYNTATTGDAVEQQKKSGWVTRMKDRASTLKDFFFGIDNTPMYHLAKRLDGGDEQGVFSEILDRNIQAGHRVEARHNRHVYDAVRKGLTDAGISEKDLVAMSTDLDPIRSVLRVVAERLPTNLSGTQSKQEVRLGNRDVKLTWAELVDLYLISNQQDGLRHLVEGGLVINGQDTGSLTPSQVAEMRALVEYDSRAKAVVDLFTKVSNAVWRPAVNATSQSLDGRDLAKIQNWWGLEVLTPSEVGGEHKEFNINLVENKSIFHARTHGRRPLILRDAFRRFSVFQGSIANYYGMAEPFRIARTLLNDKTLWDQYRTRGMQNVFDQAQQRLQHAQGTVHARNILEGVIDAIMPNTYRALLYYNPKVWMSQYTSVFNYGSYVSKAYMKDVFGSVKHIADRSLWDEMLTTSDVAFERMHTGKATLELGVAGESDVVRRNILGKSSWGNKAGWMLKAADMSALLAGWQAAKAEFKAAQSGTLEGKSNRWWAGEDVMGVQEGSPGYLGLIKRRAEYLWQRTQPSWDIYNRSRITSLPKLARSFLMFRSFHEKVLTIWNDAAVDYASSEKSLADAAEFTERVAWPVTSYVANATLRILIAYTLFGKRKDAADIVRDAVLAPLDAFPVLGTYVQDILEALHNGLRGERAYLNNENLESMPLGILNDMGKGVVGIANGLGQAIASDSGLNNETKKNIINLITRVAILNGVPAYQVKNAVKRITGETEPGKQEPEGDVTVEYD